MLKVISNLSIGSAILSLILALANSAIGADVPTRESAITDAIKYISYLESDISNGTISVTPVSQLADIRPTDWSFQALKSLYERYKLVINNDKIFQGNDSVTRYEFAAQLHVAIARLHALNAAKNAEFVSQEDLSIIQRLQTEFAPELAALPKRVENLAVEVADLTAQQFSPTAKLTGEVIFAVSGVNGDRKADDDEAVDESIILSDRVWLNFDISFNESDRLFVRLEAENTPSLDDATGTEMTRLGFYGDSDNVFDLNQLEYRFAVSKAAKLYITSDSTDVRRVANSDNAFSTSGRGAISRFGRYSPFYRLDFGAIARLKYEFSDVVSLSLGLADDDADDADDAESSLGGDTDGTVAQLTLEPSDRIDVVLAYQRDGEKYGAIAQLILEPTDNIELGLTYVRFYDNLDTGTGSELANDPFDDESEYITTSSYGLETNIKIGSGFTIGGWVGLTTAKAQDLSGEPQATIFNYALTLAFPDLGTENSLAGVVIGQPPKVTSNDLGTDYVDSDTSLHLELFYRWQATENIAITPGLLIITNPEHNENNGTIYLGTVRTTLRF
ncbi:carbohydrate porin [Chroococcidiopsis sp. CCALA 051]|uniref:iron uptake porin n=1 Tax=Chroococcidiopsis sp. CCALA 051 TaxID=869949 RepID=UPI000D0DE9D8|nr:iron uptake porin [Chroococcidiopsis sp. CCALA 051]PSM47049.1 carbohydrate porin [Chroococcidiopsis sp. CCALA 051]